MKLKYKNFYIILSCFVIIFIYGCSSKNKNKIKKPDPIPSVEELYRSGYEKYTEGKYRDSLKLFKKIETRYSFSEFAPRALLMKIMMNIILLSMLLNSKNYFRYIKILTM